MSATTVSLLRSFLVLSLLGWAGEVLAQPAAPTPLAPSGSVATPTPTFKWTHSPGATQYFLWLGNGSATVFQSHIGTEVCGRESARSRRGSRSSPGYSWAVQAKNGPGGNWSWDLGFTVVPPPAPTPVSPQGAVHTPAPTYTWNPSPGATSYFVQVSNGTTIVFQGGYAASQVCAGSTCAVLGTTLTQGTYSWSVQAKNASGGTWSNGVPFTVHPPPGR